MFKGDKQKQKKIVRTMNVKRRKAAWNYQNQLPVSFKQRLEELVTGVHGLAFARDFYNINKLSGKKARYNIPMSEA